MSCGNFKIGARNKMFIGIFWNGFDDLEDGMREILEEHDWENFNEFFDKKVNEIFKENKKFIRLESGYYEGASIFIDYRGLFDEFEYSWEGAKKRKALKIKLEKGLQELKEALVKEFECYFDIMWMGFKAQFDNGETLYDEYKEWREEI